MSKSKNVLLRKIAWFPYLLLILLIVGYSGFRITDSLETDEWRYRLQVALSQGTNCWKYILQDPTEAFFQLLKWICANWFNSSQALILISSIMTQIPILEFLRRKSPNFTLAVFIYLCSGVFFMSLIPINQYIAIALITYSLVFIKQGKFWPYYLAVIIGSLFHSSSIFLLPFPWLMYIKIKTWKIVGICILAFLIGMNFNLFFPFLTNTQYAFYQNYDKYFYGMNSYRVFFWVFQYLFALYLYLKYTKQQPNTTKLIFWGALFSMCFYIAAMKYIMFNRFELFFGIMGIAAVSYTSSYMKFNTKLIYLSLLTIVYLAYGYFVALDTSEYFSVLTNTYLWIL